MPGRRVWLPGLLVLCLCLLVQAVKEHDFKKCAQSGFCRRNRALADRAAANPASWTSPYGLSEASFSAGVYRATLKNALFENITFDFEMRFQQDGVARILLDERDGLRQRYNEAASWTLVKEPAIETSSQAYAASVQETSSVITYANGHHEVRIQHNPVLITFYRDGQPHVVLNERGLLNMEHFRLKTVAAEKAAETTPDLLVQDDQALAQAGLENVEVPGGGRFAQFLDANEDGMWEETFSGRKDTKPKGPESLSLDITFPGYEHVFGIPQHAGPLSLKTTR